MTTLKVLRLALKKALWTGAGGMRQAKRSGKAIIESRALYVGC